MKIEQRDGLQPPDDGGSRALTASPADTRAAVPKIATAVAVIAILYFGRDVFLPLAIALLVTFALAPVVSILRRTGLPRVAAVIGSVLATFSVLALLSFVVVTQVSDLATNITTYQMNIVNKVRTLKEAGASGGMIERLSGVVERVGEEMRREEIPASLDNADGDTPTPVPVEIVPSESPIETLQTMIVPLIEPLATTGLIFVVVIFMLLEREDLRDRFIRLVGYGDLHRTTEALRDAGRRVGQYLLAQLVVNTTYAIPIALGLWLLGVPNAILWGLLALVLRFVPYIGPMIAAMLPLFLALAVDPGWSLVLWTAALFITVELISNNVVEPYLYGSRTGLSPLAIIVSAIFWTWLWGPLGLVMSTPLTVCLVVLGRHVPQFEFLGVLFGNEPVLEPHARLYQRLLAGDPDEATDQAEEVLEEEYLVDFYDRVAVPALLLGEEDRARGVMSAHQLRQLAGSALTLVSNLDDIAQEEAAEEDDGESKERGLIGDPLRDEEEELPEIDLPDGRGRSFLCFGGRGELDDVAAAMLAQALSVQGAAASTSSFETLEPSRLRQFSLEGVDTVIVGFLNAASIKHARFVVRRLKRLSPAVKVGVVFWMDKEAAGRQDAAHGEAAAVAAQLNADFIAYGMLDVATKALSGPAEPAVIAAPVARKRSRRKTASLDSAAAVPAG
jgi:predicted PurR-regulated permease PerM